MDRQILRSAGLLRPTEANKILSPCATSSRQNSEPFGIADEARRVSPRKPVKALTTRGPTLLQVRPAGLVALLSCALTSSCPEDRSELRPASAP